VSPLRYSGERERAYSRLRACLLAKPGAELISDEVPAALKVRLPSLEPSQPGLQEELSFSFLADEPVVTVRILAERSYPSQPFCVQPGCIVGNAAQRRRLEAIRDEVGWNVANEPTAVGKWVPLFFNQGISLDPGEEAEARPRQRCTFYGCKEVGGSDLSLSADCRWTYVLDIAFNWTTIMEPESLDARSIGCEAHLRRHASTTTAAVATSATPTAATAHGCAPSGPLGGGSGCVSCPDLHVTHLICGTRGTVVRQTLACVPLPLAQ